MHHPTDRIIHTTAVGTPVVEHWLEREIAQWVHPMNDRSDDPSHHEQTLLPLSYISLLVITEWPPLVEIDTSTTATATATQKPGRRRISDQTGCNWWSLSGRNCPLEEQCDVTFRTPRHSTECLQWCQQRENFFYLTTHSTHFMHEGDRFGGGSVMVWVGIRHDGRTSLVHVAGALTVIRYQDEILQHHVIPYLNVNGRMFQQDNARPHELFFVPASAPRLV